MMNSTGAVEINRSVDDVFIWTNEIVAKWHEIVVED
jgi:hypothetical protein